MLTLLANIKSFLALWVTLTQASTNKKYVLYNMQTGRIRKMINWLCTQTLNKLVGARTWRVIRELVQMLQLSVTATALALYYLIYCYMQLVYLTLRSALYFHNADGAMKVTIAVVTITSLVVAFNLILKIEKLFGV